MPPLKSRAALRYGARTLFAEVETLGWWRQDRVDPVLGEERTPGYALLNFKAGIHSRHINLAAGVDNLLNRYYYEHFSYQRDPFRTGSRVPETGRSIFITLGSQF